MNYEYYSALVQAEQKKNEAKNRVANETVDFELYKTVEDVKNFLKDNYDISGNINKYPIQEDCFLTIKENNSQIALKLEFNDEVKLYYYNK